MAGRKSSPQNLTQDLEPETGEIEHVIVRLRGQRVILSADLARLYGVLTKALNQAVQRNIEKFLDDFVFQLTSEEYAETRRLRSQFVTLKRGRFAKYLMPLPNTAPSWRPMFSTARRPYR